MRIKKSKSMFALIGCVLLLILNGKVDGREAAQASRSNEIAATASDLFSVLDRQAQSFRPATRKEWLATLQYYGFSKRNGLDSSASWDKVDSTGTLRATAFYKQDETSIWLFFFPSAQVPMAAPVLEALLRNAESTTIEDAGTVEVRFKPKHFNFGGKQGTRVETARLRESNVIIRRAIIEWRD